MLQSLSFEEVQKPRAQGSYGKVVYGWPVACKLFNMTTTLLSNLKCRTWRTPIAVVLENHLFAFIQRQSASVMHETDRSWKR